ncbi:hypothetical protein D5086_031561 [Populus alba]|uniref:Uncharacterized protein n=1 Tax=Populus alba TaxID=43335 RepID=A0ACC4AIX3_POPAL
MSFSETSKQIKEGLAFFALMKYSLNLPSIVRFPVSSLSNLLHFQFEIETEGGKLRTTVSAEGNVGSGGFWYCALSIAAIYEGHKLNGYTACLFLAAKITDPTRHSWVSGKERAQFKGRMRTAKYEENSGCYH